MLPLRWIVEVAELGPLLLDDTIGRAVGMRARMSQNIKVS